MERLTYRTIKGEAMGNSSVADIGDILEKLAEYEDLEERLNGVSVKQVVDGFIKTVKNQTNEEYEHGRILTNTEADKWNEYKRLEEQGLLLRLPCKVGDKVFKLKQYNYCPVGICRKDISCSECRANTTFGIVEGKFMLKELKEIGKTVFLTKAEAEQKLKEMESD